MFSTLENWIYTSEQPLLVSSEFRPCLSASKMQCGYGLRAEIFTADFNLRGGDIVSQSQPER
jgi:hypothetical protein